MIRVQITCQYDGTNFNGWQSQPNQRTVQGVLENALTSFTGEKIQLFGSGRTDSGVHAFAQIAHFDMNEKNNFVVENLPKAVNQFLPKDVKITSSKIVSNDFHSRFNVVKKTYEYHFYLSSVELPLLRNSLKVRPDIDLELMKKATKDFVGTYDFSAFKSSGTDVLDSIRTIYSLELKTTDNGYKFVFCGNGFLYNMVRIISGTLFDVGMKKICINDIKTIIESKDRNQAGDTAPAHGLYLKCVEY